AGLGRVFGFWNQREQDYTGLRRIRLLGGETGGRRRQALGADGGRRLGRFSVGDLQHQRRRLCVGRLQLLRGRWQQDFARFRIFDYWLVWLDADGNVLRDQSFGGTGDDILVDVQSTADGGVVVAGYSSSDAGGDKSAAGFGGYDYWVLKLDGAGNTEWERAFGGAGQDVLTALQTTSDGGFLLCGYSESDADGNKATAGFGRADFWIVKLQANGDKQWEQSFGGSGDDVLFSAQQTSDGGYIFGGYSDSPLDGNRMMGGYGLADFWVVKTDADGQREWEQTLGGSRDDVL